MKNEDKKKNKLISELVELHQRIRKLKTLDIQSKQVEKTLRKATEAIKKRSKQLEILYKTTSAMNSAIGSSNLLQLIVDSAKEISGSKYVALSFYNKEKKITKFGAISGGGSTLMKKITEILKIDLFQRELPAESSRFKRFVEEKKPVIIDFHEYTFGTVNKKLSNLIEKIAGFKFILAIPLVKNEELKGIFAYFFLDKGEYDFTLYEIFANQAAQVIERSQILSQLKESEEKYRTTFEHTDTAMAVLEEDATISLINSKFEELSKYSKEEIEGKMSWTKFVHPDDWKRVLRGRKKRRRNLNEVPKEYKFRGMDKNGNPLNVLMNIDSIPGTKKSIISLIDVTKRKQLEEELKQSFKKLRKTFQEIVHALASAVEMKDPYVAGHQQRVTNLACAIATEIGLSKEQIDGISTSGLIHDIGKIAIPSEILSKPGRINDDEFNIIKNHPRIGYNILKIIEFPWPIAQIVLQHHEKMDGSGYPQGLSGDKILLEARILAVADTIEAMNFRRPYRESLGIDKALEEISKNKGILYDPQVVDACMKLFVKEGFKFEEKIKTPNFSKHLFNSVF
ncbi:PAS domain S-box protein [Patescibacteria group bacterium]|nr:PAS domain S-box protein [Patescibacteria group bacterium]